MKITPASAAVGLATRDANPLVSVGRRVFSRLPNGDYASVVDAPRQPVPPGNIGFNIYDALYAQYFSAPDDAALWQYAKDCGASIVRIMYPAFYSADYTSYVFASGVPNREFVDADFRSTFLTKSDAVFTQAASFGIRLHCTLFWTQDAQAALNGETTATAYTGPTTATAIFMQRFARWFAGRYGTSDALYCYSLGNEWVYQESALSNPSNYPTSTQLASVFSSVVDAIRSVDPAALVTADLVVPPVNVNPTRQTLDNAIECYRRLFASMSYWTLHTYISGSNYVGRNTYQPGVEPSTSNTYGFEAVHSVLRLIADAARADGKYLVIGEIGVHTGEELDTASLKKRRGLVAAAATAAYALVWNVQPSGRAGGSGQTTWFIEPGTDRANTYKSILQALNVSGEELILPGVDAFGARARGPRQCFTCSRSAGTRITFPSFPKMSSTQYALMLWLRINAALNAFETIVDLRSSTTAGLILLGSAAAETSWYAEFRGASGNAGSTAGIAPNLVVGKWQHLAVVYEPGSPNNVIDTYIDGIPWSSQVNANAMAAIPDATTLYVGGGGSGAPVSLQDVALMPFASPADVLRHMCGEVNPSSYFHLRAGESRGVFDVSRFANALTVGAGVTHEVLV